jgi:branched-chain amino acid transport system ATP-binding protein
MDTTTTTVLDVQGLSAGYGGNQVLDDVGFTLQRGEVVTLLGRNGAGKSTTLKCLMGFITEKTALTEGWLARMKMPTSVPTE